VVVLDVVLPRRLARRQRGPGHAGKDRALGTKLGGGGLLHAVGDVHARHRVLDRDALLAARLAVPVGAGEAGQDQRALPVHDVAAVELRADLDRQIARPQRPGGIRKIGGREGKVAAQRDEHLHLAAAHRLDRCDRAQSVLARRVETADLAQSIEERRVRTVVDAAGPVALHVAVPADRTRAGALAPNVTAQEQQVDDLTYRIDAVLVLRDTQAPRDDHPLRRQLGVGELPDVRLGDPRALDEGGPGRYLDDVAVVVEAVR